MQLRYTDPVYGQYDLSEPVLIDLMASEAMQRLKGVLQHGISGLIGVTSPISRFEHSLGAMLIVRRLGASVEEQIAAMLHDVSHTAFSHVIDYVVDGHDSQSYHDEKKEWFLSTTDVPQLLASHGHDWRRVLDDQEFPLLEQPLPRLCADRLDYFLRDILPLGLATLAEIQDALNHLAVVEGRIAADNLQAAQWLGYTFIKADDASWSNFDEVGLYELTAQAIRRGLSLGVISEADFWLTDEPVWGKLCDSDDPELRKLIQLVSPDTRFAWDEEAPTFRVSTKLRSIDPDVVFNGGMQPLSTLDPEFARHRADYLARKQGKWPMRVIGGL